MQMLYLKWYYGYKNFGDELLLLWVIDYLAATCQPVQIAIETPDAVWLQNWLARHTHHIPDIEVIPVVWVRASLRMMRQASLIVIWWWEVITDARTPPHNGRNYLLRVYWLKFFGTPIWLFWWFGLPKYRWSPLLHRLLYRWASNILTREDASYQRVSQWVSPDRIEAYHDFAYDILEHYPLSSSSTTETKTCIINCNPYIWSLETKQKILQYITQWKYDRVVYFPAELTIDAPMYEELVVDCSTLERYDWTSKDLAQITALFASASWGIAARLHVLLLLKHYGVPYTALVYQEKITKILWDA